MTRNTTNSLFFTRNGSLEKGKIRLHWTIWILSNPREIVKRETRNENVSASSWGGGGHCFESEIYTCRGLGADAGAFLVQPMLTRPDLLGQSPSLGTFLLPILCVCFCVYFFHQFFCVCFFFVFRFVDLSFLLWLLGSVTVWAENQLPLMLPHIRAVNMGYSIERDLARSSQKKNQNKFIYSKTVPTRWRESVRNL